MAQDRAAGFLSIESRVCVSGGTAPIRGADDFSFLHFWGPVLSGPLTKFDIAALGTKFSVPLFIVQGEKDLTTLPELTREWLDKIDAARGMGTRRSNWSLR